MYEVTFDYKKVVFLVAGILLTAVTYETGSDFGIHTAHALPAQQGGISHGEEQIVPDAHTAGTTPVVVVLHDENLDGIPDEVAGAVDPLFSGDSCKIEDPTCALSLAMMHVPEHAKVSLRAKRKCPTRKIKRIVTSEGIVVRQNVSPHAKKRCRKPTRKPTKNPTATPKPKVTATPISGEPLPAPSPEPTKIPTPSASATPTRQPTPTTTPSSGGNAAIGKSFYSQVCTACHGVKGGKSEQQVLAAMSSISEHSSVKGLVSNQTAKDIAAYLSTVR
jgi:hypothetical protein